MDNDRSSPPHCERFVDVRITQQRRYAMMLRETQGCHAIAQTIAMCRPGLICAHPVDPQACIIESLGEMAKAGLLASDLIPVESEYAAMSVATGASAAGARTYTATAGSGLLPMAEAVYGAAALGVPIVMTVNNCAADAQSTASNDHTDSMPMRDAGWIQLYAATHQEALDLHVLAFRLAESLPCPVMVCAEGSMLTHARERVDVPTQAQVDAYLPAFQPRKAREARNRAGFGTVAGGDAFMEMRYLAHHRQLRALSLIPQLANEFAAAFGRPSGGLLRAYRAHDAETIVVAMGSVNDVIREVVDELREEGARIGSVTLGSFRPFPLGALRETLQGARRVVVLEKSLAVGLGGILSDGVRKSAAGLALNAYTVIAGLGGRTITRASLKQLFEDAAQDELEQVTFMDLNSDFVARQLERQPRAGRHASETMPP